MKPEILNPKSETNSKLFSCPLFAVRIFTLFFVFSSLVLICGCETLRKKFIRKPKNERKMEEPVLSPQKYNPEFEKDVLYRNYFVYWRSWQDELIAALDADLSHKKQIDCVYQAVMNLEKVRAFLNEDKQKELDVYIEELKALQEKIIKGNLAGAKTVMLKNKLKINKRNILRNFIYSKVKDDLR